MNFKIGDKVRFLNEKGEGLVSKIVNKTTVNITIEHGFEIPCLISNLVVIHDETKVQIPAKADVEPSVTVENKLKNQGNNDEDEGIYVAFSPEKIKDIEHSDINVWLINNTSYKILFTYSIIQNGNFITLETGELNSLDSELVETIDQKALCDFSNFKVDVLFFNEKEHRHQLPISEIIKLKPIKFYKGNAFIENSFISEKAIIINVSRLGEMEEENKQQPVNNIDLSKILFQKQTHSNTPKKSKPHAANNGLLEMEIDLHIEELLDSYAGMSNAEIINIQLKHFHKALDKAITGHYKKLIAIHGIGNGRLKQEVRSILSAYDDLKFHDASFSKYGFGATEILIK